MAFISAILDLVFFFLFYTERDKERETAWVSACRNVFISQYTQASIRGATSLIFGWISVPSACVGDFIGRNENASDCMRALNVVIWSAEHREAVSTHAQCDRPTDRPTDGPTTLQLFDFTYLLNNFRLNPGTVQNSFHWFI